MGTFAEAREKHLAEVKKNAEQLNIVSAHVASVAILNRLGGAYIRGYTDIRYCKELGMPCNSNNINNYSYVIGLPYKPPLVEIQLSPSKIIVVRFLHLVPESNTMANITLCVECQHLKELMESTFILKPVEGSTGFTLQFKEKV